MKLRVGVSARHVGRSRVVIGPGGDEANLLTRESEYTCVVFQPPPPGGNALYIFVI
jgi:hypothetical protein